MNYKDNLMSKGAKLTMIVLIISFCLLFVGYLQAADVDKLVQQLKDGDLIARLHTIKALGDTKDARTVESLIANLKDDECGCTAANALAKIGKPSVEPLITALKSESSIARRNAAMALGKIKDASSVKSLIIKLKDENPIVRRNAAMALGKINDTVAVEPLMTTLKDENPVVRRNAALALKEMGSSETLVADILHE
jgi:vesicle coat complex subunit